MGREVKSVWLLSPVRFPRLLAFSLSGNCCEITWVGLVVICKLCCHMKGTSFFSPTLLFSLFCHWIISNLKTLF